MYFKRGKIQGVFVKKMIVYKRLKLFGDGFVLLAQISLHRRPNKANDRKGGNGRREGVGKGRMDGSVGKLENIGKSGKM